MKTCFGYKGILSHLFLEHSVVLSEPNHSPICQFPIFFFFHRSRALFTVLHLRSRPVPCSETMGRRLSKGLPSLLILQRLKRQRAGWGSGEAAREQLLVSGLNKERARPALGTHSRQSRKERAGRAGKPWEQVSLRLSGGGRAGFLPAGRCAEPGGCEPRKAGVGGVSCTNQLQVPGAGSGHRGLGSEQLVGS